MAITSTENGAGSTARLADGAELVLRQLKPDDGPLLARAYERLSPESRRRRFLAAPARLSEEDLRYLTDIDHRRHEAMVALDRATGELVGVARYVRVPGDPEAAELAAAVIDDWQGRGAGTQLLLALTERARENGLRRYTAYVAPDNRAVLEALDRLGATRGQVGDEIEFSIELPSDVAAPGLPERLQAALRWAASGQLRLLGALVRRLPL